MSSRKKDEKLSAVEELKQKLKKMKEEMDKISDKRMWNEKERCLTRYGELKIEANWLEEYLEDHSSEELEWIGIEERKWSGNCPNRLYGEGIRIDAPEPGSCKEDHCPYRFGCVTYTGKENLEVI